VVVRVYCRRPFPRVKALLRGAGHASRPMMSSSLRQVIAGRRGQGPSRSFAVWGPRLCAGQMGSDVAGRRARRRGLAWKDARDLSSSRTSWASRLVPGKWCLSLAQACASCWAKTAQTHLASRSPAVASRISCTSQLVFISLCPTKEPSQREIPISRLALTSARPAFLPLCVVAKSCSHTLSSARNASAVISRLWS